MVVALMTWTEILVAENAQLTLRIAGLEAKLNKRPKTPDNSSVPPSKGQNPSGSSVPKAKGRPHCGRDPYPTSKRTVLAAACQRMGCRPLCRDSVPIGT